MSVKNVETKDSFDETVKSCSMVVVDFYAVWCGPCKMISPKVEEMAKQYTDVTFLKVDVDEVAEVAEECGISAMPTFHFYKDGKKVADVVGANEAKVREQIENLIKSA